MAKKRKEIFLAVFRPAARELVITRRVSGAVESPEADYEVVATGLPEVDDVHVFIRAALAMVNEAGWMTPRSSQWTPRTVVRLHDENTEWVWPVKRVRSTVKITMTTSDFDNMIAKAEANPIGKHPERFECRGHECQDPELVTLLTTRGPAESILAREYLKANGWRAVEVCDAALADAPRQDPDAGPSLLTDRPVLGTAAATESVSGTGGSAVPGS